MLFVSNIEHGPVRPAPLPISGHERFADRASSPAMRIDPYHRALRWGMTLLAVGVVLSAVLRSTEPLFVLSGLTFLR